MKRFKIKNKKKCIYIIAIVALCIVRFLLSYKLDSIYLRNMRYDDVLMVQQSKSIENNQYLGVYGKNTLVKGLAFPFLLYFSRTVNLSYSIVLTIIYITSSLYCLFSIKKVINNRFMQIIFFTVILFNPISYSSDVFQRLYRNSLSCSELLLFIGTIINIIYSKKNNILNYIFLGVVMSIMFLTREDTIWVYLVLAIVIIYKLFKKNKIKNIFICSLPIIIIFLNLNLVSIINYNHYGTYTYNELKKSHFKDAYLKILQIKDDEKIDNVAIPKSTFYKLAEKSKVFGIKKYEIDAFYQKLADKNGEINNGNIIWYFRTLIYVNQNFKDGEEADKYFEKLSNEIEELFKEGELEKEIASPSIFINMPTESEIKNIPSNILNAIIYTSTYKNIKTFSKEDLEERFSFNEYVKGYSIKYKDYHNAENIIENNSTQYEILRKAYMYFTIVFSLASIIIYCKNIMIKDKLNLLIHLIVIAYLTILCGVVYTHTTAFCAIRYCYLCNIYILQNMFILLNLYRFYIKHANKKI